jgi:hypothetical protein
MRIGMKPAASIDGNVICIWRVGFLHTEAPVVLQYFRIIQRRRYSRAPEDTRSRSFLTSSIGPSIIAGNVSIRVGSV